MNGMTALGSTLFYEINLQAAKAQRQSSIRCKVFFLSVFLAMVAEFEDDKHEHNGDKNKKLSEEGIGMG